MHQAVFLDNWLLDTMMPLELSWEVLSYSVLEEHICITIVGVTIVTETNINATTVHEYFAIMIFLITA